MVQGRREAVRTTRTFAAMRILRSNSSFTLCISRSMALDGLATNSMAPSSSARSVLAAPSRDSELTMTIGRGFVVMISAVAWSPSTWGILMSMEMTSGLSDSAIATASRPSFALPTTCSCSSALKMPSRTFRMNAESSTTSTRNFLLVVAICRLRYRRNRAWRLRSYKLFNRCDQLIFLHRLSQKCRRTFLNRTIAMLCPRTRGNDHHGNPPCRWALAQLHHQFVSGHTRHFEIGDDQMATMLSHQFGGFKAIRRQFHAVSVLFQHSADEFAHADGVVRHHDYAFLFYAVDSFGRYASARNRRRARRKDSRCTGAGLYGPAIARFCRNHTVQVDQQNKAAVRCDSRAREEFHPAQIFAQILDNDFVFAENFFHD